jgi:dolichol-phosphate mannosyltransferase
MLMSIVIPLLNEEHTLRELHRRLVAVTTRLKCDRQIIFVDDGSTDGSAEVIRELAAKDPTVTGLRFSRNFGHEAASTAGLDAAHGDVTVLMDADLQDPPELIEQMVDLWKQDNQIVYAVRRRRAGESALKLSAAWLFYRTLNCLSEVHIPLDVGDFRLMDARVVQSLQACREHHRFVRGLVAWTGFRSAPIEYDRPPRAAGMTHYGLLKLFFLSIDAFVGFSIFPLRIASAIGALILLASMACAGLCGGEAIFRGSPSTGGLLASGLFFLGGMQLFCIGILGEYIGRIFRQSQTRPLYLVTEEIASAEAAASRRTPNHMTPNHMTRGNMRPLAA